MAQCYNFPRTDVPTNALQGQIVQYSKTLPKKPTLQASVGMLKVKAHDCPIKNQPGLFGRAIQSPTPGTMSFGQTDRQTKVDMSGHNTQHNIAACQDKYLIWNVKHSGGEVMI